jgi:hypothetical protein
MIDRASIVDEFGEAGSAEVARLLRQDQAPPPVSSGGRPVLRVANEDVSKIRVHPLVSRECGRFGERAAAGATAGRRI